MTNTRLTKEQILANEKFFLNIISMLNEGGKYGYPAEQTIYTLKRGKLCGDAHAIEVIKPIVSEAFLMKYFAVIA